MKTELKDWLNSINFTKEDLSHDINITVDKDGKLKAIVSEQIK